MPSDAEIDQLNSTLRCHDYVGRLQITIDDGRNSAVQVVEGVANLQGDVDHFSLAYPPADRGQLRLKGLTGDIIHHEIMMVLLTEAVRDFWIAGVVKLGKNVGFAVKAQHRVTSRLLGGEVVDHYRECAAPRL